MCNFCCYYSKLFLLSLFVYLFILFIIFFCFMRKEKVNKNLLLNATLKKNTSLLLIVFIDILYPSFPKMFKNQQHDF